MKKLNCKQCGYEWWPRSPAMPKLCPACKSRKYMDDEPGKFQKTFCSQCGRAFGSGDSGFSHCEDHE